MEGLKKIKAMGITLGLVMAAVGVILLVFPELIVNILATIIGALVTACGGFRTIGAVVNRNENPQPILRIVYSALLLVCGLYILFNPSITISFLSVIIGLFALLFALDRFSTAKIRRGVEQPIGPTVGFGFVHMLFGVAMICMPLIGTSMLVMLAGLYLLAGGAMVIASACYFCDL